MKRISRMTALVCLLWAPLCLGAATADRDQNDSLDEVVVEGSRHQLDLIRYKMVDIEDRFNERYNQLNTNHKYDTHCHLEARVGTNIKRRYCRAAYQDDALRAEGRAFAEGLKSMMNQGDVSVNPLTGAPVANIQPWNPPVAATVGIEAERKAYQQNIRSVVTANLELVDILRERYELGLRYEATRQALFGIKPKKEDQAEPSAPTRP